MKRKRQTVIYILIIVFGCLFMLFNSRLYLSGESFLAANETGLHYGPSDSIIFKEEYTDGDFIIIGKIGDRALSVGEGKKTLNFLYKMAGGSFTGYREISEGEDILTEFISREGLFVGLTDNKDIKEIEIDLYYGSEFIATERTAVDENGFFFFYADDGIYERIREKYGEKKENIYFYTPQKRGFDKDGNLISEN